MSMIRQMCGFTLKEGRKRKMPNS